MKEVKGRSGGTTETNTVPPHPSAAAGSSSNVAEADGEADTDADIPPTQSPIKIEPQEVDVADMLLAETERATPVPESDVTMNANTTAVPSRTTSSSDANLAPAVVVPDQDVAMTEDTTRLVQPALQEGGTAVGSGVEVPAALGYNPALTNAEGEPLMAMMTDEAMADLSSVAAPTTITTEAAAAGGENREIQTTSSSSVPAVSSGGDAATSAAAGSSSSSRHRHGESSTTQTRLKLLREKPEVVFKFLFLVVPVLFDVFSASVTLQVRMRCFMGILKATSFVDGPGMEALYKVFVPWRWACSEIRVIDAYTRFRTCRLPALLARS